MNNELKEAKMTLMTQYLDDMNDKNRDLIKAFKKSRNNRPEYDPDEFGYALRFAISLGYFMDSESIISYEDSIEHWYDIYALYPTNNPLDVDTFREILSATLDDESDSFEVFTFFGLSLEFYQDEVDSVRITKETKK